jgi:hypothetical protein
VGAVGKAGQVEGQKPSFDEETVARGEALGGMGYDADGSDADEEETD